MANIARHSKHIFIITVGNVGGNQRSTFFGSLYNDQSIAQASNYPVSCRKIMRVRFCAETVLGKQPALAYHFAGRVFVCGRINYIHATAHDPKGGQSMFECLLVRTNINSIS